MTVPSQTLMGQKRTVSCLCFRFLISELKNYNSDIKSGRAKEGFKDFETQLIEMYFKFEALIFFAERSFVEMIIQNSRIF